MTDHVVNTSKFLSLILRHAPEKIGLALDAQGWADIGQLLAQAGSHGRAISREQLQDVLACCRDRASTCTCLPTAKRPWPWARAMASPSC
ncbi:RNA 2'-phosphotransferase [Janthinobacterium sp. MDT1-19]|uniref:RNA 2'-phosphotransferase n=1 Tax=Janthinobacterium sp. MDT1-19 TaxID=1259339 RepID=UPI003F20DB87